MPPIDPPAGSRNGYGKPRQFIDDERETVTVRRPRVRDLAERFESKILPELYLHGLSSGDFDRALRGLLGEGAPLSASSIQRLKTRFELEYEAWKTRELSDLEVVYWWTDGLSVKAGIEDRKRALLTVVSAPTIGDKVVLACESGERESKESWLQAPPGSQRTRAELATADGGRRAPRDLGGLWRDPSDRRRAAVLEPQDHQCLRRSVQAGPTEGRRAAKGDAVCGDEGRLRATARRICAGVPEDGEQSRRHAPTGLGPHGHVLFVSARALAPSADDEHRRIPLRLGAAPHGRIPPLQARGGSHGHHLEDAPGCRDVVEEAERAGAAAKDRRLKPLYTPLDDGSTHARRYNLA